MIPSTGTQLFERSFRRISTAFAGDLGKVGGKAWLSSTFSIVPMKVFVDRRYTVLPVTNADSALR